MRIQGWQWLILLLIVLLLFGVNRLPDLARSMGQSLKIFKREVKDLNEDDDRPRPVDDAPAGTTTTSSTDRPTARATDVDRDPPRV